jgi:hypothetical protein
MGFVKRPINSQILAMSWYVYSIEWENAITRNIISV